MEFHTAWIKTTFPIEVNDCCDAFIEDEYER